MTGSRHQPSEAVITTNGHIITAIHSGGSLILKDGTQRTTVAAGKSATFDGQTFRVPWHGGSVAVNGHHVPFTAADASKAVVTAGGHTFTAVYVGKSVILKDGSSTITVKDGSHTRFAGQDITVGPHGGAIIVNGKTKSLSATATGEAVITAGGHTFTASDMSGSVILVDGTSTKTVRDGNTVVFDGQTISAKPGGTAVVINDGKTGKLTKGSAKTTTGIGDYVASGLGASRTEPGSASVQSSNPNVAASAGLPTMKVLGPVVFGILSVLAFL